jgi:hypothetical protein
MLTIVTRITTIARDSCSKGRLQGDITWGGLKQKAQIIEIGRRDELIPPRKEGERVEGQASTSMRHGVSVELADVMVTTLHHGAAPGKGLTGHHLPRTSTTGAFTLLTCLPKLREQTPEQ